jgi:hypothetical protein
MMPPGTGRDGGYAVEPRDADAGVGHAIEDEPLSVELLDRGREDHVGHGAPPFLRDERFEQGAGRTGDDAGGIRGVEEHRTRGVVEVLLRPPTLDLLAGHAVMDQQPSLGDPQRRWPCADLDLLVSERGEGDRPVAADVGQRTHVAPYGLRRRVGDPDAGPGVVDAGRQVHVGAADDRADVPHRTMQHGVRGTAVRSRHRFREEHHVLVGEQIEVRVECFLVLEVDRSEPPPGAQVVGDGKRRLGPERTERDVGHHVQAEVRDPRRTGILHAAVGVRAFPAGVGAQHHRIAADTDRHATVDDDRR